MAPGRHAFAEGWFRFPDLNASAMNPASVRVRGAIPAVSTSREMVAGALPLDCLRLVEDSSLGVPMVDGASA
jgi:hypothetical protein